MNLPPSLPRATYRLQLHVDFPFEKLEAIVDYLDSLGISDIYASPIFRAAPGSQHGYDVCDHNEVNPELGGMEGLMKVSARLKERKMGLLLDFVPNHMGIEGPFNWRWVDVLENGPSSRYAPYFDIEWNPRQASLQERILVPMLGEFYGKVLESGGLQLRYVESAFWVYYGPLRFPIRPESYRSILQRLAWFKNPGSPVSQKLESMARQFRSLPRPHANESVEAVHERRRTRNNLQHELAQLIETEKLGGDIEEVLKALNGTPGQAASYDNLHQILEEQHYRLAYWKSGSQEINYRRFFAVDTLVGLHMERPDVFEDTHRLLQYLLDQEIASGVRVDHIDGLWDPAEYLQRLANLRTGKPETIYLLVEKILTSGEELPRDWATHGTSGYDFTGSLIDLLAEARHEEAFTRIYHDFAGMDLSPDDQTYQLKLFIMEELFPNAIKTLTDELESQVKSDRLWCDLTGNDISLALSKIIACLPVYRTYRRVGHPAAEADVAVVRRAVAEALRRNRTSDQAPFLFIRDLWTTGYPDAQATPELQAWAQQWVCKLQQFTGAIMAKSVEDTLFYRYVRLFAANEVGHGPGEFGKPVEIFHQANQLRLEQWPASMLATSTHDTKMSEDVRARLLALSGIPAAWEQALREWSAANRAFKTEIGGTLAPDANEEYLLYQVLLGAWPLDPAQADETFRQRIKDYMRKAMSESKANTNWATPNEPWMKATDDFVEALFDPQRGGAFQRSFLPFAAALAWRGMNLSLVQTTLKLTVPGVPDIYQGNEVWDFSLVDPDNRRPVDYETRIRLLATLDETAPHQLRADWQDGRIKMRVIRALLRHRREEPGLFARGTYLPIPLEGPDARRLVAFLREHDGKRLLVVALRHLGEVDALKCDATLKMPLKLLNGHDLLSGKPLPEGESIPVGELLGDSPVAVFAGATE